MDSQKAIKFCAKGVLLVTKREKMCTRCLLTENTPGITFDESGVCNFCRTWTPIKLKSEDELIELLKCSQRKNGKYDCIVGLSGGRDSTYVLWKLVKDYRMKVLAVTYDNPFASRQAKENIRKSVELLGVDRVVWGFPNDAHRRATKKYLKIWGHHPSSALIPLVCAHCKTWWPSFFQVARKNDISQFIIGSNPLETATFKKAGFGGARTYHRITNIPNILKKSLGELSMNPRYLNTNWGMILRMYLGASHSTPYMRWRYRDVSVIRLFDYMQWNEKEIESKISEHLGWRKSPEVASSWRFDCRLDYVRRLMYASTVGITELRDLFSKMIREKQLTREEALERLKKEDAVSATLVKEILEELDLNLSDLNLEIDRNLLI